MLFSPAMRESNDGDAADDHVSLGWCEMVGKVDSGCVGQCSGFESVLTFGFQCKSA